VYMCYTKIHLIVRETKPNWKRLLKLAGFDQDIRHILHDFPYGLDIVDHKYRILFQNRLLNERFGDSAGKLCYKVYMDRDNPCPNCPMRRAAENNRVVCTEIVSSDGRSYEIKSIPIRNLGKPISVIEFIRDITKCKKMEEVLRECSDQLEAKIAERAKELRESETPYVTLVENARDATFVISKSGLVLAANESVAKLLGYSKDKFVGHIKKNLIPQTVGTYELKLATKRGKIMPIESNVISIKYGEKPAFLVIIHDLTERKKLEAQMLEERRLKYISELTTMVGHDLRNPLTAINLATHNIRANLVKTVPRNILEMLNIVERNVSYADKIIRDLCDFAADRPLKLQKTDVNRLLDETLSESILGKSKIIKKFTAHQSALVDREYVKRAFANIILNAVQSMPEDGTLTLTTVELEGFVQVSFKDTGTGISKENLPKVFEPLFTTKAKGQGLGLSTAKRMVEIQGGTITVESVERKGSAFTVRLPTDKSTSYLDLIQED
jgi:two-component system NtrC family sensor kinase